MSAPDHPFHSTDSAVALDAYVSDLTTGLLTGCRSSTDAQALLHALSATFARTLARAAKRWNTTHDVLRVLPAELRDTCMSPLPVSDKLRLSTVCSAWRDMAAQSHVLWSTVIMGRRLDGLSTILSRSGQLPIDANVDISLRNIRGPDTALRSISLRLRSLRISFYRVGRVEGTSWVTAFDWPAPVLEELWLHGNAANFFRLPSDLFDRQAPRLRSLVLGSVETPSSCPALARVTHATIEVPYTALNANLWRLLPSLRRLELVDMDWHSGMLAVHDGRLLSEVCVRGIIPRPDTLHHLCYMLIHKLSLYGRSSIWQVATWPDHAPRSEAALSVRSSGQMDLVLRRADGKEIHCAETAVSFNEIRQLLMDEYFSRILTHLVLPLRLPRARNSLENDESGDADCLIFRDHLDLPALRTLVLRNEDATPDTDALICPTNRRGVTYAPRLSRIVVDVHRETYDRAHELRASHLAAFITNVIEVNDISNLELFIDTASGLRLHSGDGDCDDEIEQLRTCVGNLLL